MKEFFDDAHALWRRCSTRSFKIGFKIAYKAFFTAIAMSSLSILASLPTYQEVMAQPAPDRISQTVTDLKLSDRKWIEIRLRSQRLLAWEGDRMVRAVIVSTGKHATPTPKGTFAVQTKLRYARMQGADYDISNVPYVMYYYGGYGIHGADWHRNFGRQVSHGCTNVAVDHARWLFKWASVGTPVVVWD